MGFSPDCDRETPDGAGGPAGCGGDLPEEGKNGSPGLVEGAVPEAGGITGPDESGPGLDKPVSTFMGQPPRNRGRLLAWVLAGLVGLLLVGVLFYYLGNFAEPRVLNLVPADTELVVCVKPNYLQQHNINKLIDTYLAIPAVKKAYDEKLKELKDEEATDYELDIRPWLGKEFALAIPRMDQPARAVAMIEYTSKAKAQAYLDKMNQKYQTTQVTYQGVPISVDGGRTAMALSGNYFVIASDKELVERVIDRQKGVLKDSITQSPGYRKVRDNLPGRGSAFAYMKVTEEIKDEMKGSDNGLNFADQIDYQDIGISLSFESSGILTNYLVTTGKAPSFYKKRGTVKEEMKATLELLPDDCIGFFHYSNLGGLFQEAIKGSMGDIGEVLKPIESQLGISVQHDLLDILRGDVTMAVMPQHGSFFGERMAPISLALAVGIKDQQQAADSMDKVTSYLKQNRYRVNQRTAEGFQVYAVEGPYGNDEFGVAMDKQQLVLGSSSQLTDLMVNKHNPLGKSENYQKAFTPFSSDMEPLIYINVPKVMTMYEDSLSALGRSGFQSNVLPWFAPIKSLSLVDSGWNEQSGVIKGGIYLRIEK
ncbi:MAG: DUF3352 domain-containing protein [Firmicutes bacterium]|nr:DUF3352 domain-containing protein [Bacillota bacterium]